MKDINISQEHVQDVDKLIEENNKLLAENKQLLYMLSHLERRFNYNYDYVSYQLGEHSYHLKLAAKSQELQHEMICELQQELAVSQQEASSLLASYQEVVNSRYWRATQPLRTITSALRQSPQNPAVSAENVPSNDEDMLENLPISELQKEDDMLSEDTTYDYSVITEERRKAEEATVFPKDIKFSILVPLYNTPIHFLEEMIDSVIAQTYGNWELCLADGSDDKHDDVGKRVAEYMEHDKRIVYRKLEKNLGISENTNACIDIATGDYIALFDHDDVLHPSVLYENMLAICERDANFLYTDEAVFMSPDICDITSWHFKPDYAPDTLRTNNYICHFSVFSKELLEKAGRFRSEFDGSQDHDLILRLTSNAKKVYHIRKLLYFWRSHPQSVAMDIGSKQYAIVAGRRAVEDHVKTNGYDCEVTSIDICPTIYRVKYKLQARPLVSILVTNTDNIRDLKYCINSIQYLSTYENYEIVIIDVNSEKVETFAYYKELEQYDNIRVVHFKHKINRASILNFGAKQADGEYLIMLESNTEIITPEWIEEMLMHAQRPEVGVVGTKSYYPDDTVQHAGMVLGLNKIANSIHENLDKDNTGYWGMLHHVQNVSAVSGACIMIKKSFFETLGGFDNRFSLSFINVDLCLRARQHKKLIIFTPHAELYHYLAKDYEIRIASEQEDDVEHDMKLFQMKWNEVIADGDPYYNPNFSLEKGKDFSIIYNKVYKESTI